MSTSLPLLRQKVKPASDGSVASSQPGSPTKVSRHDPTRSVLAVLARNNTGLAAELTADEAELADEEAGR
jgi:hypothetical protein